MEQLSIEEKARRYDEAIERAKKLYEQGTITESLSYVFPELKESEDERTRKALIDGFKRYNDGSLFNGCLVREILAWLEKQGEQKPAFEMKTPEESLGIDSETYNKIVDECVYGKQKPAWSEEDEKHFSWLIEYLSQSAGLYDNLIDWLKSLKDKVGCKVNCTTKQEWKQENTGDLTDFENAMMHIGRSFFGENAGLNPNDTNAIKEQANLLLELASSKEWSEEDEQFLLVCKNALAKYQTSDKWDAEIISHWLENKLKAHQTTWKPSEGQLECLGYAIEKAKKDWSPLINNRIYLTLKALKQQLKKLREK